MRVDSHQHFWRLDRGDYDWLTPDLAALYRDFEPIDLKPLLDAAQIDAAIVVQAAPTEPETEYLLKLAAANHWIAGVVGWTDLSAAGAVGRVQWLARQPRLVGLRPMLQDQQDRNWINRVVVAPALNAMARYGLVLDALVRADQIDGIRELASNHRGLAIVLDHAGKPGLDWDLSSWREAIARLSGCPNVHVKLSGLLTEASGLADIRRLQPVVNDLLATFGTRRMLWGSDWPVVTSKSSYAEWSSMVERMIGHLSSDERRAIMGENAERVYALSPRPLPPPLL